MLYTQGMISYLYRGRYALLDRLVFSLFTLTYTFLSARIIPKEEYGILMMALSVGAFLNLASQAGVGSAMVKYGAEERMDFGRVLASALVLKLLFASFFSILILSLSPLAAVLLHNDGVLYPLRLLPLLVFATALNNSLRQAMQARQDVRQMFFVDLAALGLLAACYGSLALGGRLQAASLVIIIVSATSVTSALIVGIPWLTRQRLKLSISRQAMLRLLSFGTSKAHSEGKAENLKQIYETTTGVALAFTIPLSILLVLLAHPIIRILYGGRYPEAVVVLRVLAIWWVVKPFGSMAGNIFYGTGRPKVLAAITLGSAVLNIGANFLLIPRFGIAGAAWASIISFSIGILSAYYFMQRWLGVSLAGVVGSARKTPALWLRKRRTGAEI